MQVVVTAVLMAMFVAMLAVTLLLAAMAVMMMGGRRGPVLRGVSFSCFSLKIYR